MIKKLKRVNPIIWIIIIGLLIVSIIVLVYTSHKQQETIRLQAQSDTSVLQAQIQSMYRSGFVAVSDIRMGEMISETNTVQKTDIVSNADQSCFITADDLGKVATVDILQGTPVFVTEVSEDMVKDLTERQCNFIHLNSNTAAEDYVDIRIMFPNGEDKVVVSKTAIKEPQPLLNSCYLWLTETQIDLLSAAIVDANLNGAKIYNTKYVKPEVEEASTVTYQPNEEVISFMQSNPDVLAEAEASLSKEARRVLENNMTEFWESNPEYAISDELVKGATSQVTDSLKMKETPATEAPSTTEVQPADSGEE